MPLYVTGMVPRCGPQMFVAHLTLKKFPHDFRQFSLNQLDRIYGELYLLGVRVANIYIVVIHGPDITFLMHFFLFLVCCISGMCIWCMHVCVQKCVPHVHVCRSQRRIVDTFLFPRYKSLTESGPHTVYLWTS